MSDSLLTILKIMEKVLQEKSAKKEKTTSKQTLDKTE
jgi:hypothetical protein